MARTLTTRIGLSKPTPSTGELVDPGIDVGTNFDKIDAAVGFTECTEATKPASPWDGQPIRCTDSRRSYIWNTTQDVWDRLAAELGFQETIYKTVAQDKTNATLADLDELQFSGLASAKYNFELVLFVTGDIAGDIKLAFTFPSGAGGATITWAAWGGDPAATGQVSTPVQGAGNFASTTVDQALAFHTHGNGAMVKANGYIKYGTSAGLFKPRFAQNAVHATATSVKEGSYLKYIRLA